MYITGIPSDPLCAVICTTPNVESWDSVWLTEAQNTQVVSALLKQTLVNGMKTQQNLNKAKSFLYNMILQLLRWVSLSPKRSISGDAFLFFLSPR